MKEINLKQARSALVVVAHPDDETIWMGGTIMKQRGIDWTIFSLCRGSDPDRNPKFLKVCAYLGAKCLIADLEDEGIMGVSESVPIIEQIIATEVGPSKYDLIFTHGANGEYGHPRHKGVHQAVRNLFKKRKLKADQLLFFNYRKKAKEKISPLIMNEGSDLIVELTARGFARKKKIMSNLYGFDPNGIDASYCTNPEAFKLFSV